MNPLKKVSSWAGLILIVILSVGYSACSSSYASPEISTAKGKIYNKPANDFRNKMRELWEDHIVWTRLVILGIVDNLAGKDQAIKRLQQNQADIGAIFKPYYGAKEANELVKLLLVHANMASEVVAASTKTSDAITLQNAAIRWYGNADEIAIFFSKINPNWKLEEMKKMMDYHLELTTNEATQRIHKDYDADILAYDNLHKDILEMADMLSDGIIDQFPKQFETK